jgi:hypothetical protein
MGLLSTLSGRKLVGTVRIRFYSENDVSVEYKTSESDHDKRVQDVIKLFSLYYSKMLYNLNRCQAADSLIEDVEKVANSFIRETERKKIHIDTRGRKLIPRQDGSVVKEYTGELYSKSSDTATIQTHMSFGEEELYSPASTLVFLKYLTEVLAWESLLTLGMILRGMNNYYNNIGHYSEVRSILAASDYGYIVVANTARMLLQNKQ